jgi:mRNA-degrading endonuclease RelE of RelBE toxin-antitoxin system
VKLRSEAYLGKPLLGDLEGYFSLRVWPYRIIYKVYEKKLIVYVIEITHRQEAYK